MGSLTKTPKAPAASQPAPIVQPPTAQTAITASEPGREERNAQTRERNLLSRERGRFGTIATGFRGFLGQSDTQNTRKTLLGE